MARPIKMGLDYFPFDTGFFSDKKIRRLRAKYGNDGIVVYIYLLCLIYGDKGYYVEYDEDLILDISDELNISENSTRQILEYLLNRSLLCEIREIHDSKLVKPVTVISAKSIQRRFQEAKKGGKRNVLVRAGYWLLEKAETLGFIKVFVDGDYSEKNEGYSEKNKDYSENNPIKESKLNKSKVNETTTPAKAGKKSASDEAGSGSHSPQNIIDIFHSVCVSYPKVRSLSDARKKAIQARLRVHNLEIIKEVFEKAENSDFLKGKNDRNWSADFDWIMADRNFAKILDGKYDNRSGNNAKSERVDTHADELEGLGYI